MNRFILSLFLLLFGAGIINAQQPAWVDYAERASLYPESDYLTGFVSGYNTNDEDPGELMNKYEELAKSKVVQSLQVSIETNNSLNISNVNGKSGEEFVSKSISFSSATITGLKTERYYDPKKKAVYAFSFVSKKELAYYNRKLIGSNLEKIKQKLTEGQKYLGINDKQNALKSFYEGMPLLTEAEQANWLMMAINREQFVLNDLKEIRKYKLELNQEISRLQHSEKLDLNEAAYFVAYGLYLQLGKSDLPFVLALNTYENTGLKSALSEKWNTALKNALVKAGQYTFTLQHNLLKDPVLIKGNYWEEGNQIRMHVTAEENNQLVAAAEGNISVDWLKRENIDYRPPQFELADNLKYLRLEKVSGPEILKAGKQSDLPFRLKVNVLTNEGRLTNRQIPVVFTTRKGEVLQRTESDGEGEVNCYLISENLPLGKQEILGQVDLERYADLDTNTNYYSLLMRSNPVTPLVFNVDVVPVNYWLSSKESINRSQAGIKTIEPALKNALSGKGYHLVDQQSVADYSILINAANTTGDNVQGIYFSYVDATLSIVDNSTGDEIFKTSVDQVKGAGSNSQKAAKKALVTTADLLREELDQYLSNH